MNSIPTSSRGSRRTTAQLRRCVEAAINGKCIVFLGITPVYLLEGLAQLAPHPVNKATRTMHFPSGGRVTISHVHNRPEEFFGLRDLVFEIDHTANKNSVYVRRWQNSGLPRLGRQKSEEPTP